MWERTNETKTDVEFMKDKPFRRINGVRCNYNAICHTFCHKHENNRT